jgi:hypothetical protein
MSTLLNLLGVDYTALAEDGCSLVTLSKTAYHVAEAPRATCAGVHAFHLAIPPRPHALSGGAHVIPCAMLAHPLPAPTKPILSVERHMQVVHLCGIATTLLTTQEAVELVSLYDEVLVPRELASLMLRFVTENGGPALAGVLVPGLRGLAPERVV